MSCFIVFALLLAQALLLMVVPATGSGMCNMYGMLNGSVNYYYSGPPKPLDHEGMKILVELCSSLLPSDYAPGKMVDTCCSTEQLTFFRSMVSSAEKMVPFCMPCLENIFRLTCGLICSPNQADFTEVYTPPSNPKVVEAVFYAVSHEFAGGFFNSCKNVKIPNSLLPFAGFLCPNGVDKCTPKQFVSSILSAGLFNVTFDLFNSTTRLPSPMSSPMNDSALSCNQSYALYKGTISSCGCVDCESSCPPLPSEPSNNWNRTFLNRFNLYQLILLSIYLFLLLFLFIGVSAIHLRRRTRGRPEREERDLLVNPFAGSETENNEFERTANENVASLPTKQKQGPTPRSRMNAKMCHYLNRWGVLVASYRVTFLVLPLIVVTVLSTGIIFHFQVTSDPIELWSSPGSDLRLQKDFFDQKFGPFYRTEQIILTAPKLSTVVINTPTRNITIGPALHPEVLMNAFFLHERIAKIRSGYVVEVGNNTIIKTVVLDDICIKPMHPSNGNCAFFSPSQYFQNNITLFGNHSSTDYSWLLHLAQCTQNPLTIEDPELDMASCLSNFLAPIPPNLVFGGYDFDPLNASALVLTYIIQNYPKTDPRAELALSWEAELINVLKSYSHPNVMIAFSSERSVEDEINRQSTTQTSTVLISYAVMFVYVALSLGRIPSMHFLNIFIEQKLMLGLAGVLLTLVSVLSSVGFFCFLKLKVTMIVLEVLPFLILAIGVDNIFLLVHAYQRKNSNINLTQSIPNVVGEVMSEVGHGMIVSAVVQIAAFTIGSISALPAVRSFSLFAAMALSINFHLQMTVFLALFALDATRERSRRLNIFCCIQLSTEPEEASGLSPLQWLFNKFSSFILHRFTRPFVLLLFSVGWFMCLFHIPSLPIGLDQTIALPINSYLHAYFHDVFSLLRAGPPVYFVVSPGFKYELPDQQSLICSFGPCEKNSLTSTVYSHARQHNLSRLASPADSWVDTYVAWLQPSDSGPPCCSYRILSELGLGKKQFCSTSADSTFDGCRSCLESSTSRMVRPSPEQFNEFLPWFLSDIPNVNCPLGGKPSYGSNVILNDRQNCHTNTTDECLFPVETSRFMAFHTALSTSEDFISALRHSVVLSNEISVSMKHKVTSYSIFYIYYEYCFTIWRDTLISLGSSFGAVLLANFIMFGFDLRMTTLMTLLVVAMTVSDAGAMYLLGLSLNPVSLVNLVMFTGVNVEFISHIARSFLSSGAKTREAKARCALVLTGSSVFSGIVLTKMLGVSVLAFSGSMLFRLYYFQMYAAAITLGTLHGLVLLPVLLSYFGPLDSPCQGTTGNILENEEEEGEEVLFSHD